MQHDQLIKFTKKINVYRLVKYIFLELRYKVLYVIVRIKTERRGILQVLDCDFIYCG